MNLLISFLILNKKIYLNLKFIDYSVMCFISFLLLIPYFFGYPFNSKKFKFDFNSILYH